MIHVSLDGHVHEMTGDERTACNLIVPHGTEWSDEPVDCPIEVKAQKVAEKAAEEPTEPKATSGRAKAAPSKA